MSLEEQLTKIVRDAINQSGLRHADVAKQTPCSEATISRIMSGERNVGLTLADDVLAACGLEPVLSTRPIRRKNDTRVITPLSSSLSAIFSDANTQIGGHRYAAGRPSTYRHT